MTGYIVFAHGSSVESANEAVRTVAREMADGAARIEALWHERPAFVSALGLMTAVWGAGLTGETALRAWMAMTWWSGPDLFVVVDDYDLVVTPSSNPLAPLSEFLAQGKDIGLHMIVARRTGGATRSTYDPIIGRLKEIGTPGLVGNGSREEGTLWGTVRPTPQPPGRGMLVARKRAPQHVQIAWLDPEE